LHGIPVFLSPTGPSICGSGRLARRWDGGDYSAWAAPHYGNGRRPPPPRSIIEQLSDHEFEVFQGLSILEVASRLHLSAKTVDAPRLRIIVASLKSSSQHVFSRYIELFSTKRRVVLGSGH
jgi:hypothetical protein